MRLPLGVCGSGRQRGGRCSACGGRGRLEGGSAALLLQQMGTGADQRKLGGNQGALGRLRKSSREGSGWQ